MSRKTYEESCEFLQREGLLPPGPIPTLPSRAPRDDDSKLGVSFFRTSMAFVKLIDLTLPRTFFGRSEVRGVAFCWTDLSESTACWNDFVEVDFSEADLSHADLRSSVFQRVSFRGAILRGADLRRSTFRDCAFAGADLTGAKLSRSLPWFFRITSQQRRTVDWRWGPGPEPEGG